MAFNWKQCTVIMENRRKRVNDCWAVLKRFESKVTPRVYDGLCAYLRHMHKRGDVNKLTPELLKSNIEKLLCKCCNKSSSVLIMKSDVVYAEDYIIENIKKAILLSSYKTIYNDEEMLETYDEYKRRTAMTDADVEKYMKGIIEL